ncbi:hypothetical protein MHYP_G00092030 [Metynnis hypsauchen]
MKLRTTLRPRLPKFSTERIDELDEEIQTALCLDKKDLRSVDFILDVMLPEVTLEILCKHEGFHRYQGETSLPTSGSFAPVDLVFGASPGDEAGCEPGPKFVTDLLDTLHNVHHAARVNLSDAGLKQKRAYDTRCSGEPLVVGQSVWLFSPKRTRGLCPKLQSNWVGPCSVLSKLGEVVYRVKWGKRRLVVHRDRLAPYRP